jgi:SAM-dependent methyltransferase
MFYDHGEDSEHYYRVGFEVAEIISENTRTDLNSDKVAILDFASGFGRGTRFIKAFFPNAHLWSSELVDSANEFCAENFGCTTFPSAVHYSSLVVSQKFDLIWVGSLVTHLSELATRDLLAFLRNSLKPNGKIIISNHGSLVYERLLENYNYGLGNVDSSFWSGYNDTGYSYKNYPNEETYGISIISENWWIKNMAELGLELENYYERRWDNHHDVVVLVKSKKISVISKIKRLFKSP